MVTELLDTAPAKSSAIRVLIVDDHAIVREGLKRILADAPEFRVAGEAASGTEAIKLVHENRWDVMLLDISLPGANGLEVLRAVKEHAPKLPVPEAFQAIETDRVGKPCPDCGGSGQYTGLQKVEPCATCEGRGRC